ncbi:MAG: hypothetical protein ACOY3P_15350 [Planctomycetota bacterium]
MTFSVGLYCDFSREGEITFCAVPATHSSDYVSEPEGILSDDQAEHVSWQLCRTLMVYQGAVGRHIGRQEEE